MLQPLFPVDPLQLQFPPQGIHRGLQLAVLFLLFADGAQPLLAGLQLLLLQGLAQVIHRAAQLAGLFQAVSNGLGLPLGGQTLLELELFAQCLNRALQLIELKLPFLERVQRRLRRWRDAA